MVVLNLTLSLMDQEFEAQVSSEFDVLLHVQCTHFEGTSTDPHTVHCTHVYQQMEIFIRGWDAIVQCTH